jgi:DNA-directed RNA polymerase subunit beta'
MTLLAENVIKQISDLFTTFKSKDRTLELKRIWAEDSLDPNDFESQLKAKDNEQTWGIPIKAQVQLVDNKTKTVIGKPTTLQVAKLPKMTSRFSFIVDGGEYQVDHLLKLRSGVYTRIRRNGDLVSEFMLRKGGNKNFDLELDRKHSLIKFTPKRGSAHIPVYPLMKVMGVSDDQMEQMWGKQVFATNKIQSEEGVEKALRKFYEKTGGESKTPTMDEVRNHVYQYFDDTQLLPETTKVTLGKPFEKVNGDALLHAVGKLIKLERKEVEPDDRDSLVFKEAVHVEDFVPEKLFKSRHKIFAKVRNTLYKDSASEILQGGDLFNRPIKEFFTQGGNVSERSEQTNPVQMLSGNFKTTLIAKDFGGIKDADKLGDEMRTVNPSHFGFLDPMHTPESERTGITLHLGSGVRKEGTELKAPIYDLKQGKHRTASVPEFHQATVVLPDQVTWKDGKPVAVKEVVKAKGPGGDIVHVPFHKADFVMPTAKGMFSYASNLIPFLPCDQGNRASMADKQMEQAISLKHREAPLVQSVVHPKNPDQTFEKLIGGAFASHRSPVAGKVTKVDWDAVHIHDGKAEHRVQKYDYFPLNDPTTMMHSVATVKPGDDVKAGQVVADTNFTKGGTLALGTNLRVGYLPYKGYNFEDGIVISETAAEKLTSEHLHKLKLDVDPEEDRTSKNTWKAHSSRRAVMMSKDQWHALDDDGIIKPGSRVTNGQVLATCLTPNLEKSLEMVKRFGTKAIKPWKDKSLVWDEDYVGTVTRVVKSPNGKSVKVFVKTEQPAEIGDKLSGRHGNKGIITKILPDKEMPFTKHGEETRSLDVLLNPSGVPTRMNVGQVLETAAGKIAEKTGKPYIVNNFAGAGHNYLKQVRQDLKAHGITDEEQVYDPNDVRKPLGSVLVGPQHLLKLKHQVEKKLVVRGGGSDLNETPYSYDPDHQPVRGGAHGGQGFGALELYSLLGHNARHNLREMSTYKSDQQSEDFWRMVQEGHEPRVPPTPFAYTKFEGLLKGLGVDVQKHGTSLRMVPMTDKDILKLAGRNELQNPGLVVSKTLKPEKGGLFDPIITGQNGEKWSFFRLSEPLPNPLFVGDKQNKGPIPSLLSLKHGDIAVEDVDAIVTGKKSLDGKIGGAAIRDALKDVNVDESIKSIRTQLTEKRGTKKDQLNRTLKYLLALKDHGKPAHEAFMMSVVPVLPPMFRPLTATSYGDVAKSSLNDLYRNVMILNDKLQAMPVSKFGFEPTQDIRVNLWNGFKALQAVGDYKPIYDEDSHDKRQFKGIVEVVGGGEGEQPKEGYFQSKLIKRKQDLSIRSTIVPEPSLHIDEVGLPRHAAMELYKPFVIAHMHTKFGYQPDEALSHMQKDTEQARKALDSVMKDRPLLLKRDPALHKFSVMAFQPTVHDGKAIKIHPLVTGGFNADFDGDTMAGTVPISREAVEEAKRMFPSKNLFSPTTGRAMHVPNQEFMLGLHLISKWGADSGKSFASLSEMKKAHDKGQLAMTDVAVLGGKQTTLGRALIAEHLPSKLGMLPKLLRDPTFIVKKGTLGEIVTQIAKDHPEHFATAVNHLKDLGTEQSFKHGFSIGLKDFEPVPERDRIVAEAQKKADLIHAHEKDPAKRDEKLVDLWTGATKELDQALARREGETRLSTMVFSGARGKKEQLRQMVAAPMLVQDSTNKTVPHPVLGSYGEGLDVGDYWLSQHGARKGTLQRASGTREPGAMTKDIINSTISTLITSEDCHTSQGISMPLDHPDIHDRFLAVGYGALKPGTLITPEVVNGLKKLVGPKKNVQVRSPLRCEHGEGVCAKCFGLSENGRPHEVGTNIGVLAGQALGEPATQLAMDAFHSGGIASGRGGSSVSRIERLKQLLRMPKTLRGSAVLAHEAGSIQAIKPNLSGLGGHDVLINGISHHVREGELHPELKVGVAVTKGQSLSKPEHPVHPKELLNITKDMREVQRYLTDELYTKLYKGEDVRQRNVELVVRALTNYTRVKDPGHSHWEVGDIVPHSVVEEHNRELKGTKVKPVLHEPILEGSNTIPRLSENWMARLNYQRLGETIQRAAGMGWKSDIHGSHPIPGIAYGKEFGKPTAEVGPKKNRFAY